MLRSTHLLLPLTLILAACDKEGDRVPDLKSSSSRSERAPRESRAHEGHDDSAPAFKRRNPLANPGSEADIRAIREGAAKYASDPVAGLAWISKTAGSSDDSLRQGYAALLDEMLKNAKTEDVVALLDKPEAGPYRQALTMELYGALARKNPDQAWALLKQNPGGVIPLAATRMIVSQQVNRDGVNAAFQAFRANNSASPSSFFLASIATESGLPRQEVTAAFGLLREANSNGEAGFSRALGNIVANVQPADRSMVTSYLAERPEDKIYDQGYRAATTLLLDSGDPSAAASWASRITDPTLKEAARGEVRESLKTVDAATREKVENELQQK
ncbi:MAG: hypothetical protein QM755_21475 [Luteolibacter sp.]